MDKNCRICNNIFKVKPSHYHKRFCCGVLCRNIDKQNCKGEKNPNFKEGGRKNTCVVCNKVFTVYHYQPLKCCSKSCLTIHKKNNKKPFPIEAIKALKLRQEKSKSITNLKKVCSCGNLKDIKANKCNDCWKEGVKSFSICIICKTEFKKSLNKVTCSKPCRTINLKSKTGDRNGNWKGGIKTENQKERATDKYKEWRTAVFIRDKYKCQHCGIGGDLQAHHIKPFAKNKELRTELSNGLSLCKKCHNKHHRKYGYG